jgi:hypothetical protein
MLAGNKGEWSEVYALLKVIADKHLCRGDGNLNKITNAYLPIIKILRDESDGTYQYEINQNIVIINGAGKEYKIPIAEFQDQSVILLNAIKNATGASFSIPEIEEFISKFNCKSLKASSAIKSDIRIVLHDAVTGTSPELGFSIKSQLGSASTLLNAGKTTNFIYKISGSSLSAKEIEDINLIDSASKIKDRLLKISLLKRSLEFIRTERSIFSSNLTLIDSALPIILSEMVYSFYTTQNTNISDLVNVLGHTNPLKFDNTENHPYYAYKIKRLLTDVALGMMPSQVWTGKLEATGGYLVVKRDGEVLSYHIYNRNDFEDYLLNNTKLETASTTKFDFGKVYSELDGKQYIKLNLQIRFIR